MPARRCHFNGIIDMAPSRGEVAGESIAQPEWMPSFLARDVEYHLRAR
jgi:hypothetical protein